MITWLARALDMNLIVCPINKNITYAYDALSQLRKYEMYAREPKNQTSQEH